MGTTPLGLLHAKTTEIQYLAHQLKQSTKPAADASTRPEWKLDDLLWQQLMKVQPSGQPILSGSAAAILDEAKVNAVKRRSSAEADAGRLQKTTG